MLDEYNIKIIELLKQNARASYAEIGREIHLSPSSVRERVQYLIDTGIIKNFTVEINQTQLGFGLQAFVLVKLFSGKLMNFISIANQFKEVQRCYRITGQQNVMLEVLLRDQKHLQDFLDIIMVYGDTTSYLVLSVVDDK
jgi:Lrp/AsnC family leucine-responsive transcriptional regulator